LKFYDAFSWSAAQALDVMPFIVGAGLIVLVFVALSWLVGRAPPSRERRA